MTNDNKKLNSEEPNKVVGGAGLTKDDDLAQVGGGVSLTKDDEPKGPTPLKLALTDEGDGKNSMNRPG